MPLYEYQCGDCSRTFDLLRPYHLADETLDCPVCGSDRIRRKISVITLRLDQASNHIENGTMGACCGRSCGCASHGGQG
ncbi:MAG: zinc ribbon domain-containing protein [Roseiflexus sp.]|jgi:putative FmdB family regulatory protein|nr:zinc ribbon domain-containing protein [Roseiflexus sp.]MBO9363875.1 zinc ribbon domain-containing protein [Roseiflexus sp.]MBO9381257.1 zinc ribbon domain-containing protein [Roseiflexus sp.]MBO9387576.1 zinc ribbon domain-containing protein [Roseiflexus sp.]